MKKAIILIALTCIIFVNCFTNTDDFFTIEGVVLSISDNQTIGKNPEETIPVKSITWLSKKNSHSLNAGSFKKSTVQFTGQVWNFIETTYCTIPDSVVGHNIKILYKNIDPTNGIFLPVNCEIGEKFLSNK